MAEQQVPRRLAAILAADVVGFSRLMGQDELGTLAALKGRRREVLEPLIARHRGRIFKVAGDGVLVEFASAVDAVQCAIDLQRDMDAANGDLAEDRRIILRVGIDLGDVMVEGGDLYGDGVNIAARLEGIAEPGGVLLSGSAYDQVKKRVSTRFDDLGTRDLKNIADPVRVYRVALAPAAASAVAIEPPAAVGDKPSIAVLPFTNMSGDPDQQYFSDGITEDIITELSQFRSLFVIARNSSFQYREKSVDVRRVARDLAVQYVVEGSIRKSGANVRITAQLIDAATGNHIWAERYDRGLSDIFAIQDEVTTAIVAAVAGRVRAAGIDKVRRKRTESMAAYDYFLQGLAHWNRAGSDDTIPAQAALERAIEIDPELAQAHAQLALVLVEHSLQLWSPESEGDRQRTFERARVAAERAVTLDSNDALCHCALGMVNLQSKSFDRAGEHYDIAHRLNPNDADVLAHRSILEVFTRRPEDALRSLELATRLNPIPPNWYFEPWGMALYDLGRYAEAAKTFERSTAKRPYVYRFIAACYAQLGRMDEARALVAEAIRLQPDFLLRYWASHEVYDSPASLQHMLDGMRKAGLPE